MRERVTPILRVKDADRAVAWYQRLGFTKESEHRFGPGMPAFVAIVRRDIQIFLSEHAGDARPDTLIYLTVTNVDVVAAEFGLTVEEEPWGREVAIRDTDDNRLRFGSPSLRQSAAGFSHESEG